MKKNLLKLSSVAIVTLSLLAISCKDEEATPATDTTPTSELILGSWEHQSASEGINTKWTFEDSTFAESTQECEKSSCDDYSENKSGSYDIIDNSKVTICYQSTNSFALAKKGPTTVEVCDTIGISSISSEALTLNLSDGDKTFDKVTTSNLVVEQE